MSECYHNQGLMPPRYRSGGGWHYVLWMTGGVNLWFTRDYDFIFIQNDRS